MVMMFYLHLNVYYLPTLEDAVGQVVECGDVLVNPLMPNRFYSV